MTLTQLTNAAANGYPVTGTFATSTSLLKILQGSPLRDDSLSEAFVLRLKYGSEDVIFEIRASYYYKDLVSLSKGTFPRKVLRTTDSYFSTKTKSYVIKLKWTAAGGQDYDGFSVTLWFSDPTARSGNFELTLDVSHRYPYWKKQLDDSLGIKKRVRRKR